MQDDVKDYGVKMEEEPLSLLCRFIKRNDDLQKKIYDARAELNGKDSSVDVLNVQMGEIEFDGAVKDFEC